jgi:oxygen-dependent protoporphyrinogen oxidase
MSGLARAHALATKGGEVRVLEGGERPGGVIRTERTGAYLLELGPNTVRPTPEIWGLVRALGLEGAARLADPRLPRFIESGGRLHRLVPGPAALATGLLSPAAKLRVFAEPFVAARPDPDESVHRFFARRLGRQFADRLVAPFVAGIWAGDADRLAAADAFPALAGFEREHGGIVRGALAARRRRAKSPDASAPRGLLSFEDGLETLPRALAGRLGPRLSLRAPVRALRRGGAGRWIAESDAGTLETERVVLATSAGDAARLLAPLAPGAARALDEIPAPPLAVVHLVFPPGAFEPPLRGFGHLVVPRPGRRILGAVWASALFPGRAPEGETLIAAFAGGTRDPSAADLSDEALSELAAAELSDALGARRAPRLLRATRWRRAIPQYTIGHAARAARIAEAERALPGLQLLGNYRGGVSVGDVVRNALAEA